MEGTSFVSRLAINAEEEEIYVSKLGTLVPLIYMITVEEMRGTKRSDAQVRCDMVLSLHCYTRGLLLYCTDRTKQLVTTL